MAKKNKARLALWQGRLAANESAYSGEVALMDRREKLYLGDDSIKAMVKGERKESTPHVRNICAELIESQVNSSIPQPKVTACRKKDEAKAKLIEDMLRNELDRMPFELLNDMMERTVPIQGGAAFLVEWDNTKRTHTTIGELTVSAVHPKQIVPQDGVYSGIEDMDYIILKLPQTKEYIQRKYDVDVSDESETEPDIKGPLGEGTADDLVTQYVAYYRNESGGIGLYSWVNDVELEDIDDYQARRLRRCVKCGAIEPLAADPAGEPAVNGILPGMVGMTFTEDEVLDAETKAENLPPSMRRGGRRSCPYCGSTKWEDSNEEFEEIYMPIVRSDGSVIPGATPVSVMAGRKDEDGIELPDVVMEPTRIPFYKPDIFPVILQKNVSVYGRFLGDSDIDKIETQQNTTNRIEAKIIDKLVASGSYITLPEKASIKHDAEDGKVIRLGNAAEKSMIDVFDMEGNVQQDLAYLGQIYEEARQVIGITDSFQGRQDRTATSGRAKEFAAAQSAGRLESKRVMKNAAYAALFEAMFKFKLAYTDEPRPVVSHDIHGNTEYETFSRYDFLEQDAAGEWHWNDRFLFSVDATAPLASNREAMWQETRMNLETGAFGDPTNPVTLTLFWQKMEMLHYPGASETRAFLEEEMRRQERIAAERAEMAARMKELQRQTDLSGEAPIADETPAPASVGPVDNPL